MWLIALGDSRLKGKVHGNTTLLIAETPLMAIAISRTGSAKVTIAWPQVRVIGRLSQAKQVPAIKQFELIRDARTVPVPVQARDSQILAHRTAWAIMFHLTGPAAREAERSGRPMEISTALSAAVAPKVCRPLKWVRRRASVRAVRR